MFDLWNQLPSSLQANLIPVPLPLTCLFLLLPYLTVSIHHWLLTLLFCSTFAVMQHGARVYQRKVALVCTDSQ